MVPFHWPIPIPMDDPHYAKSRTLTSLFEKLIVASIDPLLACLVISSTGLYINSHSFNK